MAPIFFLLSFYKVSVSRVQDLFFLLLVIDLEKGGKGAATTFRL